MDIVCCSSNFKVDEQLRLISISVVSFVVRPLPIRDLAISYEIAL